MRNELVCINPGNKEISTAFKEDMGLIQHYRALSYSWGSRAPGPNSPKESKILDSKAFRFGEVFKVIWSESSGTIAVIRPPSMIQKNVPRVRRIILVNTVEGHSLCSPIFTYAGRGVRNNGIYGDHAIIYSSATPRDILSNQDNSRGQGKGDLRSVYTSGTSYTLDSPLQFNHTKSYTIENNAKVKCIGDVAGSYHGASQMESTSEKYPRRNSDKETGDGSQHATDNLGVEWDGLHYFSEEDHRNLHQASVLNWSPKAFGATVLASAVGMGGTFVWLNHTSGPGVHFYAFRWIVEKATRSIPNLFVHWPNVPGWAIFALFATSTVLFTGTASLWAANAYQKCAGKALASLVFAICFLCFTAASLGAEEIVLVAFPLSISIGILASLLEGNNAGKEAGSLDV